MQCQVSPDVPRKRIPRGVNDIYDHMTIRIIPFSTSKKARTPLIRTGLMKKRHLPLMGKRNRRHHDPDHQIRIQRSCLCDCCKRQKGLSGAGHHIGDSPVMIILPGVETLPLPLVQLFFICRHRLFPADKLNMVIYIRFENLSGETNTSTPRREYKLIFAGGTKSKYTGTIGE